MTNIANERRHSADFGWRQSEEPKAAASTRPGVLERVLLAAVPRDIKRLLPTNPEVRTELRLTRSYIFFFANRQLDGGFGILVFPKG